MLDVNELRKTFSGKTVFISGHTGFKGSWLCFILRELGARVIGYSLYEPENAAHCYYALKIRDRLDNPHQAIGDVRDIESYRATIGKFEPDFIFHLAAQAIVSTSYREPLETFSTNCMGVANALEVLRLNERRVAAVIITSDKCYKNKERLEPYRENEEMGGDDPYSASKGAAELIFHSYFTSYFNKNGPVSLASGRAGNVFGGGDWSSNRLIPDCMRDLMASGEITIRMPEAVRPWTFVIDILNGYINLAASLMNVPGRFDGSWNFASGETRTVMDVCRTIIASRREGSIKIDRENTIGKESGLLLIDPGNAIERLGWKPRYGLDQSLGDTAEWYFRQNAGDDMVSFSQDYIAKYLDGI